MKRQDHGLVRLFCVFLLLLIVVSCGRDDIHGQSDLEMLAVPEFDVLGFDESSDVVRRQVLGVYKRWQEQPLDANRNGRLAMHLSVYDKQDVAEVLYRRARILAPDAFRWAYYLATTLKKLGRQDEAIGMFREVIKMNPGYPNSRLQLAELLLEYNDTDESRKLYESFTIEFPDRIEGWFGLGKTYFRIGKNEEAAVALQRALELGPQYGDVHYALAFVYRALGDKDAAEREFAAFQRTSHYSIRTDDMLLRVVNRLNIGDSKHYETAVYHYNRADYKRSAKAFRDTLTANPAYLDSWAGLVSTQIMLGDIDAAGNIYREALAAGVRYARMHLVYGKALLERQQFDAAREVLEQALALDPKYGEALAALGELELQSGTGQAATEAYRRLLEIRPNDPGVKLSLAQALNAAGRLEEAAALLEPLTTNPDVERPLALKELALAYRGMGRTDESLQLLRRSREEVLKISNFPLEKTIERLLGEWSKEPDG